MEPSVSSVLHLCTVLYRQWSEQSGTVFTLDTLQLNDCHSSINPREWKQIYSPQNVFSFFQNYLSCFFVFCFLIYRADRDWTSAQNTSALEGAQKARNCNVSNSGDRRLCAFDYRPVLKHARQISAKRFLRRGVSSLPFYPFNSFFNRSQKYFLKNQLPKMKESNNARVSVAIVFLLLYMCSIIEPLVSQKKSRVNDWFQSKLVLFTVHLLSIRCGNFPLKWTQKKQQDWPEKEGKKNTLLCKMCNYSIMIIFYCIILFVFIRCKSVKKKTHTHINI